MDKGCQSSGDSSLTTSSSGGAAREEYLKHLNKLSHKISKPIHRKPSFESPPPPPPVPPPNHLSAVPAQQAQAQAQAQAQSALQAQPQHQPPVYNINKNDFRDVVQKLTGSPAHDRPAAATAPPVHQPKAANSRLQRIRPPPLAHFSNRPPPLLNGALPPPLPNHPAGGFGRPAAPLSPLPPLPAVHAAAESPVSAYMRYLHSSMSSGGDLSGQKPASSGFSPLAPLVSPRWSNLAPPQQQGIAPPPPPMMPGILPPPPPSPPIPFGCLNSPRSPYPLLSPSLLLSPSSGALGFPQLPLSPTVPMPSPRWRGF